jgi:hypothetical protein
MAENLKGTSEESAEIMDLARLLFSLPVSLL